MARRTVATILILAAGLFLGCGGAERIEVPPTSNDTGGDPPDAGQSDDGAPSDPGTATDPGPRQDAPPRIPDGGPPPVDGQACTPGFAFCKDDLRFVCKADGSGYDSETCPKGCQAGQCLDQCAVGETICMTNTSMGTCQPNGTYLAEECKTGPCQDGQCVDETLLCQPGQVFCEAGGKKLLKCADDGASAANFQDCPHGCNKQTNQCNDAQCTPGFTKCADDGSHFLETCNADASGFDKAPTPCPWKCDLGECISPICEPGQTKCAENAILTCGADQLEFEVTKECSHGCAMDGATPTCGVCESGETGCEWFQVTQCVDPLEGFEVVKACGVTQTCGQGECVDMVMVGKEDATKLAVYPQVLKALAICFGAAKVGVCGGFNTKSIDFDMSNDDLTNWICADEAEAFVGLFDSKTQYKLAKDLVGCDEVFDINDLSINTGVIHSGQDGKECYAFSDGTINGKEVYIDSCEVF